MDKNKIKLFTSIKDFMIDVNPLMKKHGLSYSCDKAEEELFVFLFYKALALKK